MVAAAAVAAGRPSAHALKAQAQELQHEEERPGTGECLPKGWLLLCGLPWPAAACSHDPNASDYKLSLDLKNKQVPRASDGGGKGDEGVLPSGAIQGTRDLPTWAHLCCRHTSFAMTSPRWSCLQPFLGAQFVRNQPLHGRGHTFAMPVPSVLCSGPCSSGGGPEA